MRKVGATQWTMAKLITMILAVFLLVLVIYGVQNKGFGPLRENIEGRYNEVLIFLGFRDDGTVTCGEAFVQSIDDVGSGEFFPCENNCSFVIDKGGELLGFSNFTINRSGFSMKSRDNKFYDNDKAYIFGLVESERHRKAYELLNKSVGEFLNYSNMSYEDFVGNMSFDYGRVMYWEIHDAYDHTAFAYIDGEWIEGQIENGEFDDNVGKAEEKDILDEIDGYYRRGGKISVGYSDFVGNEKEEFAEWFDSARVTLDEDGEDQLYVFLKRGWGGISYFWDGKIWEGMNSRWVFESRNMVYRDSSLGMFDDDEIIDVLYEHYIDGEAFEFRDAHPDGKRWLFEDETVSYNIDISYKDEDELKAIFNKYKVLQDESRLSHFNVVKKMSAFLTDRDSVDFYGESISMAVGRRYFGNGHSVSTVSFSPSDKESFGLSYRSSEPILVYNQKASPVSEFVGLSGSDWEEFLKINKIYEYFRLRRCGQ